MTTEQKQLTDLDLMDVGSSLKSLEDFIGATHQAKYTEERWGTNYWVYVFPNGQRFTKDEEGFWCVVNS